MVRGTPHLFGGYFFYSRRENFEELEKLIVLNEQLDWSRLRNFWELEGLSDQHFFCTTARESPKTVIVLALKKLLPANRGVVRG